LDVSQLRCTFNIDKTILRQPNLSEISIYNLSSQTENAIIKEGMKIIIEAGYEGDQYGIIFIGNVIQPLRTKENGTDYKLTLTSQDGDNFLNAGLVNFSMLRGQVQRDIVNEIATKAKYPTEIMSISDTLSNARLTRGKVIFGLAKDYLTQIAQSNQANFYIEDNKINIIKVTDLPTEEIIDLSPKSGLVGVPEQIEYGVKCRCLLNPCIKNNTFVHIDNSIIQTRRLEQGQIYRMLDQNGIYRVIHCVHIGDTRGNDWYTEFEAITQSGYLPDMLANGTQNPS